MMNKTWAFHILMVFHILILLTGVGLGYWWGSELAEKSEAWYARVVNEAVASAPSSCPDCGAATSYQGLYRREFGCGSVWRAADADDNGESAFLRIGVFTAAPNCHASEPTEIEAVTFTTEPHWTETEIDKAETRGFRRALGSMPTPRCCHICGAARNFSYIGSPDSAQYECGGTWDRYRGQDGSVESLSIGGCGHAANATPQPASAPAVKIEMEVESDEEWLARHRRAVENDYQRGYLDAAEDCLKNVETAIAELTPLPPPDPVTLDSPGTGISFPVTEAEYAAYRRAIEDHIETLIPPETCPLCGKPAKPELSDRDNRAYTCGSSWTRYRYAEGRAQSCVITDGCTNRSTQMIFDLNSTTQPEAGQILIGDGLPPSATWTITDPSPDSYWQAPAPRDLGGPVWDDEWDRNHDQVGARPGYATTQPEARP